MTRMKRAAAAGATTVLLGFGLTACGDDDSQGNDTSGGSGADADGPPADASVEEFCATINDESAYQGLDFEKPDPEAVLAAIQGIADNLEEVGTPEDISDDAREGFEISLNQIDDLEVKDIDFASGEDPFEAGLSEDEKTKVEAFNEYESATCPEDAPSNVE
jgi:hypothetical protein